MSLCVYQVYIDFLWRGWFLAYRHRQPYLIHANNNSTWPLDDILDEDAMYLKYGIFKHE